MLEIPRRSFLAGILVASIGPAIVRASSLMTVKPLEIPIWPPEHDVLEFPRYNSGWVLRSYDRGFEWSERIILLENPYDKSV